MAIVNLTMQIAMMIGTTVTFAREFSFFCPVVPEMWKDFDALLQRR